MRLIIDNREPKEIITLLQSRIENVTLENLELGDYVIQNSDNQSVMIFERKSLSDLISSIKDGRYNEQALRLSECDVNNRNIYYVIEGNIMNFCNRQNDTSQKMLFSSMLSISSKKGFSLLNTTGFIETAEFIIRFYNKVSTEKIVNQELLENRDVKYSNVIKTSKKANITKDNINEIMISQIPGISTVVAGAIIEKYYNIFNLVNCLKEDQTCLDNFKIASKNGERKIGKNIIAGLKEYLL
ncbi:ERCC4-type nuclease [Chrysochromulina ericina virus CeV-01B]|jgi:ERCC4-type nuclease|uniref:ERCC4 domain-containing protein EP364R n=1 Tax=Chrysochromulina ericina virus CeV-01B TaxID=3070830 RepID=A0A0N9Q9K6_9VIRU|nr:ERCC4-type nuclease [Chrysochromulina ericina virus]ALH23275.1 ERCC4-type nuclease [Chrysochromulina ericina virus CeV-01B]|tara:strand:- start:21214 stop:21939 length:726 start_codon:yes stop_codon:yes gene_type:complete